MGELAQYLVVDIQPSDLFGCLFVYAVVCLALSHVIHMLVHSQPSHVRSLPDIPQRIHNCGLKDQV